MLTGSCLCGRVRYEINGKIGPMGHCHCVTCRKAQGGAFVTNAPVRTKYFTVTSGAYNVAAFESSPGKKRCFCRNCGAPLWSQRETEPDIIRIRAGILDGDPERRPLGHVWVSEKAPWFDISDDLPQWPRGLDLSGAAPQAAPPRPQPDDNAAYRFPVSVKGVIMRDRSVVLLQNERDEWELPGGKLEPGETPETCLVREIAEELALSVSVAELLDTWVYEVAPGTPVFIVTYGCIESARLQARRSDEHKELTWLPLDALAGAPLPEGYRRSIHSWARSAARQSASH